MKRLVPTALILILTLSIGGCDLVGDILEFGFWMLVILIVVIALLVWALARLLRGRRRGPRGPRT